MQTLKIDMEDNKVDIILNLIKNLKDDVIKGYTISSSSSDKNLEADPYFYERRKDLHILRDDIKSNKIETYDFNESMDELIKELES